MLLEDVGETAFREAAVQRHLAAFKTAHDAVAGNAARALAAAGGRLAHARAHTAPNAFGAVLLAFRRFQIALIHDAYFSTNSTRCGIFFTMPRNAGVSGRSTT